MSFHLHMEVLNKEGAACRGTALILHGIYGCSRNWKLFGRNWSRQGDGLCVVLMDLRGHGESHGASSPHTMRACAEDLDQTLEFYGLRPKTVVGHSFGGKVALHWLEQTSLLPSDLWVLDSPPGPGPAGGGEPQNSEVGRIIDIVERIPSHPARRSDVSQHFLDGGLSSAVARWMATNLWRGDDGLLDWHFDPVVIRELLADYWATDAQPIAEDPPGEVRVHLVRAMESRRWTKRDLLWLDRVSHPRTFVHELKDAGHWLHVDSPDELMKLIELSSGA